MAVHSRRDLAQLRKIVQAGQGDLLAESVAVSTVEERYV
jgi:hypothetical protein